MCENKDADQLRGNHEADQRLCFRYIASTIPLLPKNIISCLLPSSVAVQPGLCGTRLIFGCMKIKELFHYMTHSAFTEEKIMREFLSLFTSVLHKIMCCGFLLESPR